MGLATKTQEETETQEDENLKHLKEYITDIENDGSVPIRFVIYNNRGEFQGYKVDSAWDFDDYLFKPHPDKNISNLIRNLEKILSWHNKNYPDKKIGDRYSYIVVEQIDQNGDFVDALFGYHVTCDKEGKFQAF